MKHFGYYDSAEDLQYALSEGTIGSPYVAIIQGSLDYNSITPESYIGEWYDDGEGNFSFNILDSDPSLWGDITIATGNLVFEGASTDVAITIYYDDGNGEWHLQFAPVEGEASNPAEYYFSPGTPDSWETGLMTADDDSDAGVMVDYDGDATFTFYSGSHFRHPLYLDTINPEYPGE